MYDKALAVDANDVVTLYNYALLMEVAKKDFLGAERLYLRALQVSPPFLPPFFPPSSLPPLPFDAPSLISLFSTSSFPPSHLRLPLSAPSRLCVRVGARRPEIDQRARVENHEGRVSMMMTRNTQVDPMHVIDLERGLFGCSCKRKGQTDDDDDD